jgi:hypothetical protein
VGAEFVSLVPTIAMAVLAIWSFKKISMLGGSEKKEAKKEAEKKEAERKEAEKKEAEKKNVKDGKDTATSGVNAQGVRTMAITGGSAGETGGAGSGHRVPNAVDAPTTASGGQSVGGGGEKPSDDVDRPQSRRNGHALDDVELGFGVGGEPS